MNTPLPPKTSMMWVNSKNTFEETTETYGQDGNLISLTEKSDLPSDHIDGSPPERSMFWEGETKKIEIEESEPNVRDYTKKEPEDEVATVNFIPVRYAIDEIEDDDTQPFGLPEDWKGSGPARLTNHSYTLRQLRDGWLYIYDAKSKSLDEYNVEGNTITQFKLGAAENIDTNIVRGAEQEKNTYLSYPEGSVLSLCFSIHRWSWTFFEMVANSPDKHIGRMQTVVLDKVENQPHIGSIDALSEVADIENTVCDDQRFAFSCLLTKAPEDSDFPPAKLKPVAIIDDLTSSLPEEETAYVVAINDHKADIEDLAHHLAGSASQFRVFEEQFSNQWMLMQTIMQLCMFGATEDTNLPRSLKTEADKVAFYSDMAEYYDASSKVDKAAQNQSAVASGYPAMFSTGAKEAHQNSQEKLAKAIRDKYRISESKFDRYEHWIATDKWRKQLNWSQMMSEMHELSEEKERLLKPALSSKTDFIAAMDALSPKHLERIVDLWSEDTQFELHSLHQTVVDAFALVSGESDQQWADQQWQRPTSLWALNGAGFSESIFKKLGGDLRAPLPDLAQNTSNENSEINSDENTEKSLSEHLSKLGMGLSIHSKLGDFISNPNTHETLILKDLAKGFSQLDGIFTASAAAITRFVAEMGADAISKSTVMMLASINTPVTRNTFYLRALILERLASATTIEINPNYASDFKTWKDRLHNSVKELKKQTTIVKAFEANDPTVSKQQYQDALKQRTHFKRVVTGNALEYKQQIVIPSNAAKAMKAANMDILEGKVKSAEKHFKDLGGLGTVAFIFNLIALYDAMQGVRETGLMDTDDFLDVQQKFFACAAAWTGFTTGKAWGAVKGNNELRRNSLEVIKKASSSTRATVKVPEDSIKDLRYFNRWLSVTACFGMISAGIEAYRGIQSLENTQGRERTLQYANIASLTIQSGIGLVQFVGSTTGRLSANFMFGGPIMGLLLVATITYILVNVALSKLRKDAYEVWLSQTPWGTSIQRVSWSKDPDLLESSIENQSIVSNVIHELQSIIKQPLVGHKIIEKVTAFPQYTHRETIGIKLYLKLPEADIPVRVRTNLNQLDSDLIVTKKEQEYTIEIYQQKLPTYLSIKIEYPTLENKENKNYEYWFQHLLKPSATYSSVVDNDNLDVIYSPIREVTKQQQIETSISSNWLEL